MTYSEDYPSFAGDQTGQLLAEPDVVALSPVTSARVVETQSGYLVVLKKVEDRLSLSVKRRIGTPPSSHVILTPDESIQLSRVLSDSVETLGAVRGDFFIKDIPERSTESEVVTPAQAALSTIYGETPNADDAPLDWDEIKQPWRKRKANREHQQEAGSLPLAESPKRSIPVKPILIVAGGVGSIVAVVAIIIAAATSFNSQQSSNSPRVTAAAQKQAADPMSADKVDKFVRNFVANMLDFNPKTYRASQIHAMAAMQTDVLEKYWQETGFPLSRAQLRELRKDQTLMINKVVQQPSSDTTSDVELSADLVTPGEKVSTPIRLQIDLGLDQDNQLVVTEMKDSTPKKEE